MQTAFRLFLFLLLCSTAHAAPIDEQPIRIGVSGPFSGGSSPMGESMRNGIRLAVEEINSIGGVDGRKIELLERDDQANPEVGARIAQEFIRKKVAATIGVVNTPVGLASVDVYQHAKVPLVIAVSTGTSLTRKFAPPAAPENYIFRISPTLDLEAKVLASDLKKKGIDKVAVLADVTAYGDAGLAALEEQCQAEDIDISSVDRFLIGDNDMNAQVHKAKASGARALVAWGIGPELAAIARSKD